MTCLTWCWFRSREQKMSRKKNSVQISISFQMASITTSSHCLLKCSVCASVFVFLCNLSRWTQYFFPSFKCQCIQWHYEKHEIRAKTRIKCNFLSIDRIYKKTHILIPLSRSIWIVLTQKIKWRWPLCHAIATTAKNNNNYAKCGKQCISYNYALWAECCLDLTIN